jgi:GTP pyrophosphokinase
MSIEYCHNCNVNIDTDFDAEHFVTLNGEIVGCVNTGVVDLAREYARVAFQDVQDDEGHDYFDAHLQNVVDILKQVTDDPHIIAAGYLHDVLEDTPITAPELEELFGADITSLVLEVTHEGQKDEYGFYFPRLETKRGIVLKFADRLSNLSRMGAWDSKRQAQYLKKSIFWNTERFIYS